jgi:hypothetical protein
VFRRTSFRGSARNREINNKKFGNTAKIFKYSSKYRGNFCTATGNTGVKPRNIPEERTSHQHGGGNLKSKLPLCLSIVSAFTRLRFLAIRKIILGLPLGGEKKLENTEVEMLQN